MRDIKYIINTRLTQLYSKCHSTLVNYFNTRNNITPDILACLCEMQLFKELALGKDCSTVPLVTMIKILKEP